MVQLNLDARATEAVTSWLSSISWPREYIPHFSFICFGWIIHWLNSHFQEHRWKMVLKMCPLIDCSIFFLIKGLCIVIYGFWPSTALPRWLIVTLGSLLSHNILFSRPDFAIPEIPVQSSHLKCYICAVPSDKWKGQDSTYGTEQNVQFFLPPPPTTFPLFFLLTSFLLYIRILKYYLIHCLSVWDIQFILNSQLFQVFNILNLLKYCLFLKCSIKEKKSNFVHTFCI